MADTFGAHFRELRGQLGIPLRQFCTKYGFDPGNISKIERGLMTPPAENVEAYARALKLRKGSEEWADFLDLAAAARGEVPSDLLGNDDVVRRLPLVFRTLRGKKAAGLDDLVDKIRKA
jgi:transcriptional regulator with XRE-family HTH domain